MNFVFGKCNILFIFEFLLKKFLLKKFCQISVKTEGLAIAQFKAPSSQLPQFSGLQSKSTEDEDERLKEKGFFLNVKIRKTINYSFILKPYVEYFRLS